VAAVNTICNHAIVRRPPGDLQNSKLNGRFLTRSLMKLLSDKG
jgi:hypothetical protein